LVKPNEKKNIRAIPADISLYCVTGKNVIHFGTNTFFHYIIVVQLFKRISIADLLNQIKNNRQIPLETGKKKVIDSFSDNNEVQAVSSKLSVIDPLKLSKIILPGRAVTCKHIECFDLETFLQMNERVRRWICPICEKPILFSDLRLDCYFLEILRQLEQRSDVLQVCLNPDGTWATRPSQKELGRPNEAEDRKKISTPHNSTPRNSNKECIALDSDEDNADDCDQIPSSLVKRHDEVEGVNSLPVIVLSDED
jgi:hypothetical protein